MNLQVHSSLQVWITLLCDALERRGVLARQDNVSRGSAFDPQGCTLGFWGPFLEPFLRIPKGTEGPHKEYIKGNL